VYERSLIRFNVALSNNYIEDPNIEQESIDLVILTENFTIKTINLDKQHFLTDIIHLLTLKTFSYSLYLKAVILFSLVSKKHSTLHTKLQY
jgi:hypothetical protein